MSARFHAQLQVFPSRQSTNGGISAFGLRFRSLLVRLVGQHAVVVEHLLKVLTGIRHCEKGSSPNQLFSVFPPKNTAFSENILFPSPRPAKLTMPARMLKDLPFAHVRAKMLQARFVTTLKGMCPKVALVFGVMRALLTDENEEGVAGAQWPLEDAVAPVASVVLGLCKRHLATAPDLCTFAALK